MLHTPELVYHVDFCVSFQWTPSHCQERWDCSLPVSERVSHRSTSTVWACPSPVLIYQTQCLPTPLLSFPPSSLSSHLFPWGAVLGFMYWVSFAEPCGPCCGILLTSQHPDWAKMSSATLFKSWLKTLWAALQTGSRLSKMVSQLLTRCWWFVALL